MRISNEKWIDIITLGYLVMYNANSITFYETTMYCIFFVVDIVSVALLFHFVQAKLHLFKRHYHVRNQARVLF